MRQETVAAPATESLGSAGPRPPEGNSKCLPMGQQDCTDVGDPLEGTRMACPTCGRLLRDPHTGPAGRPRFFPFCSERCRLVDLNAWLDADYRIVARPDEESEDALAGDETPA